MGILDELTKGLSELGEWAQAGQRKRIEVWQSVAAKRGGYFTPRVTSFLSGSPACIDVVIKDVAVHVDTYTVKSNNSSSTYTRFRSSYLLPVGPVYRIAASNVVSELGTAFGFEDVLLGDAEFDNRFVVRTADAVASREAWNDGAMTRMLTFFPNGSVRTDGHEVRLVRSGVIRDALTLDTGIALVATLGAYGAKWMETLRSLPGARWSAPTGAWNTRTPPAVRITARGVEEWIYPVLSGVGLTLCVAAEPQRELATFECAFDGSGTPGSPVPDDLLNKRSKATLRHVGPCTLSYDGRYLRAIIHGTTTHARIVAATELIAELSLGSVSVGVYR